MLSYSVSSSADAAEVSVDYKGDSIGVVLPRAIETAWAESGQVTIEGSSNAALRILVEKDFQCLHKSGQQDADAYPNPLAAAGIDLPQRRP
jgi:hypothetical protein